jgi:CBS domain-containing protein
LSQPRLSAYEDDNDAEDEPMSLDARESFCLASPASHSEARPPRLKSALRRVNFNDPAVRVVNEFTHDGPRTVSEDCGLDDAQDELFRWGARALLVTRDRLVIGIITADDIAGERLAYAEHSHSSDGVRVDDLMTHASDVPAIEWQTVLTATVRDMLEIFEGTGAKVLLVVETESATLTRVRGLIHRSRLNRQLGVSAHA